MLTRIRRTAHRVAASVLVATLVVNAAPGPTAAVGAGTPGPVLFAQWSNELQDWFLYTLAPGGEPVIVPGTNRARGGRWSPDGKVITYAVWNQGIYIVNPDGSGKRLLFEPGEGESIGEGIWSPDGTKLAFTLVAPDAPLGRVEIADSLTGERERLDTGLAGVWDWSADGYLLGSAWRSGGATPNSNEEIAKYSFADGTTTFLTDSLAQEGVPRLSPDGRMITFLSYSLEVEGNYSVGVMNSDGSDMRLIRSTGGQVTWPAWSPDGQAIVFGPFVRAMTIDGLHTWPLGGGWAEDGFDWAPLAGTTQEYAIDGIRALALADPSVKATASASSSRIKPRSSSTFALGSFAAAAVPKSLTISQMISEPATATLKIFRPSGALMRTVKYGLKTGRVSYTWNGRLPNGRLAPRGRYKFVARAVDLAGNVKKKTMYVKVVR